MRQGAAGWAIPFADILGAEFLSPCVVRMRQPDEMGKRLRDLEKKLDEN